ncbi:MAG: PRC-barrel domain-containing protein [Erythrobacter sp.]|uniref:photosynthetic reaction center subunit H n=1 Tax=Erythrobacter sp. TaxID=1042 RepID=UPI001AFF835C|nr:photosynthetic reaction center subunit H [Erythrobacter sp.]MBO6768343.1 PRC-barrel domain-containing protein [Erythrobacter sp.]
MDDVKIVGTLDVTQLVFYAFVLFFIALVFYLRREDRREGYPTEAEDTGMPDTMGGPLSRAAPKTFDLPHGQGTVSPDGERRERVDLPAKRAFGSNGAPYVPTGDPFADGLGPAAWAERMHTPDLTASGKPRIVPLSSTDHVSVSPRDPNPVGMTVIGADGETAGMVTEAWVDMSEHHIRYLEIGDAETPGSASPQPVVVETQTVAAVDPATETAVVVETESVRTPASGGPGTGALLVPMAMAKIRKRKGVIVVDALRADQFAGAPRPATPGQITLNEEERIVAYFGGGYLYADPQRQEPII